MDNLPSVLFASCIEKHPSEIITLLLGKLPESKELEPGIKSYPWHISTKYYEVDINLCTLETKLLGSQKYAKSVQGVVILFDSDKPNGLDDVNKWLPYINEYEAPVKMLLCSCCKEASQNGTCKRSAQEWCIKEGFELIELDPNVDEEWESEQDFVETTGIKRVRQALEAHVWPNLSLKERKEPTTMSALWHGGVCQSAAHLEPTLPDVNDLELDDLLNEENEPGLDFSDLFSHFVTMKERAATLPSDMRKEFAEQIVCAYWKAIGGDQEELLDI